MMEPTFKLRWLNGLLAGRELLLPNGEIRLGGDDPDLALPLEQKMLTVLIVAPEGITLNPPLPTWGDGLPWDSSRPLPLQRVVDLAGQAFVLGSVGESLPYPAVPPRHQPETQGATRRYAWLLLQLLPLVVGTLVWFFLPPSAPPSPTGHLAGGTD